MGTIGPEGMATAHAAVVSLQIISKCMLLEPLLKIWDKQQGAFAWVGKYWRCVLVPLLQYCEKEQGVKVVLAGDSLEFRTQRW